MSRNKPRSYIYVHKVKFTKASCGRHKKRMNKAEKDHSRNTKVKVVARSNFYPNGHFVPYQLPQSYERSKTKQACGNCGLYSNRRSFCGNGERIMLEIFILAMSGGNDSLSR